MLTSRPPSPPDQFYSLEVAVHRLVNREEKQWGCFRVTKMERNLYRLDLDEFPSLSLQLGTDGYTYKAWWGAKGDAAVVVRKRQKQVTQPLRNLGGTGSKGNKTGSNLTKTLSLSPPSAPAPRSVSPATPVSSTPVSSTQYTYDVQWRSDTRSGQNYVTSLLAQEIFARIEQRLADLPDDGVKPKVTLTAVD